ncbi:methyl-accepting chemotaxis protein [Natronobacillus azotifigens]|uniref:Methyl-accepting chemotaxis protein n=1 Tax=Natronobacillus azotifigens TaxID=472978 RepID=A0A9J6R817_9BACI|nr:methyl-accepting chemotaxis protein [Natronobacillus azotifigens]MCZ0701792.1 methyl-accepting chemotaxis protein [Natronobacillus azotifigens]
MTTKRKGRKKGIRCRLIFSFSIIAVLPLLVIGGIAYYQASVSLEQEVGHKVEDFARVQMEKLDRTMYERTRDIQNLSERNEIITFQQNEESLTPFLDQQLNTLSYYESFSIYDLNGVVTDQTSNEQVNTYNPNDAWWTETIDAGLAYSDITYDKNLDRHVIIIHTTISTNNRTIGLLEAKYNVEHIWDDVNHIVSENSIVELVNNEGTKIADTVSSASVIESIQNVNSNEIDATTSASIVDEQIDPSSRIYQIITNADAGHTGFIKDENSIGEEAMIGFATSAGYHTYRGNNWSLIVSEPTQVALSSISQLGNMILWVTAATLLTVTVLSIFISNSIAKPLIKLKNQALLVANGNLAEKIIVKGSAEIQLLADAMNTMIDNLQKTIKQTHKASNRVDQQSSSLKKICGELQSGSEQLTSTMQEIAAGAENQASHSGNIVSASQKLDEQINAVSEQAVFMEQSSKNVWKLSTDGTKQMDSSLNQMNLVNSAVENAVVRVKELEDRASAVSELTEVINNITEQTNLLALNAAIESARAGEAGKGFNVVANEIRKLAEQVSGSAVDIANVISEMQQESKELGHSLHETFEQADKGVAVIKESANFFADIKKEVATMNKNIAVVAQALLSIEKNSKEMNNGINQIAAVSEESTAGIGETVAFIQEQRDVVEYLSEQALGLQELSNQLQEMISAFKV